MKMVKLTAYLLTILICCQFILQNSFEFYYGFEDGYNCFGDSYNSADDFLVGKLRHEEGYYDYWWGGRFWYQQGYEEGYKKAAKYYYSQFDLRGDEVN